jgi:hypothetical protein
MHNMIQRLLIYVNYVIWNELLMCKGYEIINKATNTEHVRVFFNKYQKQCNAPWDWVWPHQMLALNEGG